MRVYVVLFACGLAPLVGGGCFDFGGGRSAAPVAPAAPDPCAPGVVVDLNQVGTRVGDRVHLVANNTLPGPRPIFTSLCGTPNGNALAFRYTPQRSGRLHVTTNSPQTAFDTVVWVVDRCSPTAPRDLGCNDDGHEDPVPLASTLITTEVVPAGVPVFIVVAGFRRLSTTSGGVFRLTVTELRRDGTDGGACRPTGAPCDGDLSCPRGVCRSPAPAGSPCDVGTPCAADARCSAPVEGECRAPGANGGVCRAGSTDPCDPGLVCNRPLFQETRCVAPIPVGAPCSFTSAPCTSEASCTYFLPSPTCVLDGARGGRCVEGTRCDAGLTCLRAGFCGSVTAAGEACDPADLTRPCAEGVACRNAAVGFRCGP